MFTLDVTPFLIKINKAKNIDSILLKMIEDAYNKVTKSIIVSLSGPIIPVRATKDKYPQIGTIPIPRRTFQLYWSAVNKPSNDKFLKFFWLNPDVAPYRTYVHDGTKYQKERPIFQIQTDYWRPIVFKQWEIEFKKFLITI